MKVGLSTTVCVDLCVLMCVRNRTRQTEEDLCAQAASVERDSVCEAEGWRCFALNGTLT